MDDLFVFTEKELTSHQRRLDRVLKGLLEMPNTMAPIEYLPYRLLSPRDQERVYIEWGINCVGYDY